MTSKPIILLNNLGRIRLSTQNDPRLLDKFGIPINIPYGEVSESALYQNQQGSFGNHYNSYQDINRGMIYYYLDSDVSSRLFDENIFGPASICVDKDCNMSLPLLKYKTETKCYKNLPKQHVDEIFWRNDLMQNMNKSILRNKPATY